MLQVYRKLLKKSGKPTELPEYKYVYAPWEGDGPSQEQIERARRKFQTAASWKPPYKPMTVPHVPDNMYTFGKEGMTVPIAIFKGQEDPVIGPEWTYPGIYDIKKYAAATTTEQLIMKDRELRSQGESLPYWQRRSLRVRTNNINFMAGVKIRRVRYGAWRPFQRVKGKKTKSRAETAAQKKAEAAAAAEKQKLEAKDTTKK